MDTSGHGKRIVPGREVILPFLLFLLGILVYSNSFPGNFYIDDVFIVEENPLVETLDLRAIFTTDYWGADAHREVLFRPLTILSFALNRNLLGAEPWSYHLINVILHALVGLVMFLLLRRWGMGLWRSFFAAAIFAVHPMHSEVLNMVVGRAELLVALFFLLGLYLAASEKRSSLIGACGCFLLALLAKEHAITFLGALLLSELFFRRMDRKRLPFYLSLLAIVLLWLAYRELGPVKGLRTGGMLTGGAAGYQPMGMMGEGVRLLTALKIQLLYLRNLFFPFDLPVIYDAESYASPLKSLLSGWGSWVCLVSASLLGLTGIGWYRRQLYGLAIPLYAVCFSVTANLFFVSGVVMAERSAYLPSVWFCLALLALLPNPEWNKVIASRATAGLLSLFILLTAGETWSRNIDYRDPVRLWSRDFERDRGNLTAATYLQDAYVQEGDYARAIGVGEIILAAHPRAGDSLQMQAWLLFSAGRPAEALVYAERALEVSGGSSRYELLMTLVLANIELARPDASIHWLNRFGPAERDDLYWQYRGEAYEQLGDFTEALASYRRVADSAPGSDVEMKMKRLIRKMGKEEQVSGRE